MSEHLQPIYAIWDGNAEALASDIDELGVTVRQWRNRGDIPSRAWPKIIRAAAAKGATLRLESFLPCEVKKELAGHGGAPSATAAPESATNVNEIIGTAGEGGHGDPFAGASAVREGSSPTCSTTDEPPLPLPDSQSCSSCSSARAA
jgi:hypothetical protein